MNATFADIDKYAVVPVDVPDLITCKLMSQKDRITFACIRIILGLLNLDGMELRKKSGAAIPPGNIKAVAFRRHWVPFASDLLINFFRNTFCPWVPADAEVDGSKDEEWMGKFQRVRDDLASGNYMAPMKVPIVPTPGTVSSSIVTSKATLRSTVRCVSVFKTEFERGPQIHVVTSNLAELPDIETGQLQSTIACVMDSFRRLSQMEEFATRAENHRSHPAVVLQYDRQNERPLDRAFAELMASAEINPTNPQEKFQNEMRSATAFDEYRKEFNKRWDDTEIGTETSGFFTDPTDPKRKVYKLLQPMQSVAYQLREGVVVGPQPTLSTPPADLSDRYERHAQGVCIAFGIPYSIFGSSKKTGTQAVTENDLQLLTKTVTAVAKDLQSALNSVLHAFEMDVEYEVILHPQSLVNPEILLKLYELGAMDERDLQTEVFDAYNLHARAKKRKIEDVASARGEELPGEKESKKAEILLKLFELGAINPKELQEEVFKTYDIGAHAKKRSAADIAEARGEDPPGAKKTK